MTPNYNNNYTNPYANPPAYNPDFANATAPPAYEPPAYTDLYSPAPSYPPVQNYAQDALKQAINKKTDWVLKAEVPQDYAVARFFGSIFKRAGLEERSDKELKVIHYRHAGQYFLAKELRDEEKATALKSDDIFQGFLISLPQNTQNAIDCFEKALKFGPKDPKTYFEVAKADFYYGNYETAIDDFTKAYKFSNELPGTSYRKDAFAALCLASRAACYERLNQHDKAVFDYIDAQKIDPDQKAEFKDAATRAFQILKTKQNKSESEIKACIQFSPNEPDFQADLAQHYLNCEKYQLVIDQVFITAKMAYGKNNQTLLKAAAIFNQAAYELNS